MGILARKANWGLISDRCHGNFLPYDEDNHKWPSAHLEYIRIRV